MQDRIGQILGNYRLIHLTGTGGHAEVYLAEHIYLKTHVAIKFLTSETLDKLEQDKFFSEAKFMTTLKHPHIIEILDFGFETSPQDSEDDRKTPYLIMEYAPHGTLRNLYPHGTRVPLSEILSYTKQIAEALQYAHDQDIIHLDVKPENMLLRRPNDVVLSDFGIAVAGLNTGNLQQQSSEVSEKTARGEALTIPGTALYLAPERLLGHNQRASDQYSLGIVVYEWLGGKRPFNGSDKEICQQQIDAIPPSLRETDPWIPEGVAQVVMKALSKRPEDRYASVEEFAIALEEAVHLPLQNQSAPHLPTIILQPSPNRSLIDYPTILQQSSPTQSPADSPTSPPSPSSPQTDANAPVSPPSITDIPTVQLEWWRQESQSFILPDSIREASLRERQSKDSNHSASPGIRNILNGFSRLFTGQKQQPDILISSYSSQMLAPSTTLFPGSIRPPKELKDFFISHSRADDIWADWIAQELEDAGFSVIVPNWDFHAGSNLKRHMDKAAAQTKSSIVILSPAYFNTSNTQSMRDILLGRDTVNKDYIILPVLVHEISTDLKMLLEHIKYIDLVKLLDNEEEARATLLAEVRGERARPRSRTAYPGSMSNEKQSTSHAPDGSLSPKAENRLSSIETKPIEIFFSYSHRDEELLNELKKHLSHLKRSSTFKEWHDRNIDAGSEFAKAIDEHLKTAQIILLLVSPDFITSDYCYDIEMRQALKRHDAGEAFVVPVILRPASWRKTPFGKLNALPNDGKPVTTSLDRDAAFVEIAAGIERLIEKAIADKL